MFSLNRLEYLDEKEVLCLINCSFFALRKRSKAVEEIPEVGLAIGSNYGFYVLGSKIAVSYLLYGFNLKRGINSNYSMKGS